MLRSQTAAGAFAVWPHPDTPEQFVHSGVPRCGKFDIGSSWVFARCSSADAGHFSVVTRGVLLLHGCGIAVLTIVACRVHVGANCSILQRRALASRRVFEHRCTLSHGGNRVYQAWQTNFSSFSCRSVVLFTTTGASATAEAATKLDDLVARWICSFLACR
jgi:hypothetical protein